MDKDDDFDLAIAGLEREFPYRGAYADLEARAQYAKEFTARAMKEAKRINGAATLIDGDGI